MALWGLSVSETLAVVLIMTHYQRAVGLTRGVEGVVSVLFIA